MARSPSPSTVIPEPEHKAGWYRKRLQTPLGRVTLWVHDEHAPGGSYAVPFTTKRKRLYTTSDIDTMFRDLNLQHLAYGQFAGRFESVSDEEWFPSPPPPPPPPPPMPPLVGRRVRRNFPGYGGRFDGRVTAVCLATRRYVVEYDAWPGDEFKYKPPALLKMLL